MSDVDYRPIETRRLGRRCRVTKACQTAIMAKAALIDERACLEGADVSDFQVPVSLDAIFDRLDLELRNNGRAVIAVELPKASALAESRYDVLEIELVHGGRVKRIDMVRRARELGCLQDCETALEHWYRAPRFCRAPVLPS
jgi:hypothetical protein